MAVEFCCSGLDASCVEKDDVGKEEAVSGADDEVLSTAGEGCGGCDGTMR